MKKIVIAVFIVAAALAACGKKKTPAGPGSGSDMGSGSAMTGSGSDTGSAAAPAGSGSAM